MSVGLVVKPRISGLAYSSIMLFFSAPSAKSFTWRSETDFMGPALTNSVSRGAKLVYHRREGDAHPFLQAIPRLPPQLGVRRRAVARPQRHDRFHPVRAQRRRTPQ